MPGAEDGLSLDVITHTIRVGLTPVFLLNGIAVLLNVFSTRLARVADRMHALSAAIGQAGPEKSAYMTIQLSHLRRRLHALDVAVVLASIGGAATCGTVLTLFVGALRGNTPAAVLFGLFGVAVAFTMGAVAAYTTEMLMASRGVRADARDHHFHFLRRRS